MYWILHHTKNVSDYTKKFITQLLSTAVRSKKDIIMLSHRDLGLYKVGSDVDIKLTISADTYSIDDLKNLK